MDCLFAQMAFTQLISHVNEGLAMKGAGRVQAVLGADVLTYHRAVIDYATMPLFLHHAGA